MTRAHAGILWLTFAFWLGTPTSPAQDADADPLTVERIATQAKAAASLADVAATYVERSLPRCAVDILRDAAALDRERIDEPLGAAERAAAASGDADEAVRKLLWDAFHPWPKALLPIRRQDPRKAAAAEDAGFGALLDARTAAAEQVSTLARRFVAAARFDEAFELAATATRLEHVTGLATAKEVAEAHRTHVAEEAARQRTAFWKGSKRKGKWKKAGKTSIVAPPLDRRPTVMRSKDAIAAPYRVTVDVDLEQQPGGGGPVVLAQDAKNYYGLELNTQGMGLSLYLTRVVKGERTIVAGSGSPPRTDPDHRLIGNQERLYYAARIGPPVTLLVDVTTDELIVSTRFGELFRYALPEPAPTGAYGLVRSPYSTPKKRRQKFAMTFSNLLVEAR